MISKQVLYSGFWVEERKQLLEWITCVNCAIKVIVLRQYGYESYSYYSLSSMIVCPFQESTCIPSQLFRKTTTKQQQNSSYLQVLVKFGKSFHL